MRTNKYNLLLFSTILAGLPAVAYDTHPDEEGGGATPGKGTTAAGNVYQDRYRFDGHVVAPGRVKILRRGNGHRDVQFAANGAMPGHEGSKVIHAHLFDFGQGLPVEKHGDYAFRGDLKSEERDVTFDPDRLIYSDGLEQYFFTTVTQERWEREGQQMGAVVVSYNPLNQLSWAPHVHIPQAKLPEGLYKLTSIESKRNERVEVWIGVQSQKTVPSKSDRIRVLRRRMENTKDLLPQGLQGKIKISLIKESGL